MRSLDKTSLCLRSRQFYHAFYQWALLTTPSPRSSVSHANLHDSARLRVTIRKTGGAVSKSKQYNGEKTLDRESGPVTIRKIGHEQPGKPAPRRRTKATEKEDDKWQDAPVQTTAERPFDTLEPWEQVVRYNSFAGIMLQMAVPEDTIEKLHRRHGSAERMKEDFGAAIEIGQAGRKVDGNGDTVNICSVLISGMHDEVKVLRRSLMSFRTTAPTQPAPENDARNGPPASNKPSSTRADAPGASTAQKTRQPSASATAGKNIGPWSFHVDLSAAPQSEDSLPDNALQAGQCVLREKTSTGAFKVVVAIPERFRSDLLSTQGFNIQGKTTAQIRGLNLDPKPKGTLVPVEITGNALQLTELFKILDIHYTPKGGRRRGGDALVNLQSTNEGSPFRLDPDAAAKSRSDIHSLQAFNCMIVSKITEGNVAKVCLALPLAESQAGGRYNFTTLFGITKEFGCNLFVTASPRQKNSEPTLRNVMLTGKLAQIQLVLDELKNLTAREQITPTTATPRIGHDHSKHSSTTKDGEALDELYYTKLGLAHSSDDPFNVVAHLRVTKSRMQTRFSNEANCILKLDKNAAELIGTKDSIAKGRELLASMLQEAAQTNPSIPPQPRELVPMMPHQIFREKTGAKLSGVMRTILRKLTHPVVLITAANLQSSGDSLDEEFAAGRGVTVSSFNTITMSSQPYVSFNLKVPSRTWDVLSHGGEGPGCRIHIIAATPGGAAIANAFTQPYDRPHEPFCRLVKTGVDVQTSSAAGRGGIPEIGGPDVLARFKARIVPEKCLEIEDHVLVVAKVISATNSSGGELDEVEGEGLAYADRAYRGMGGLIEPEKLASAEEGVEMAVKVEQSAEVKNSVSASRGDIATQGGAQEVGSESRSDEVATEDAAKNSEWAIENYFEENSRPHDQAEEIPLAEATSADSEPPETASIMDAEDGDGSQTAPDTDAPHHDSPSSFNGVTPRGPQRGAWGLPLTPNSSFSTLSFPTRRNYSSTSSNSLDHLADPSVLKLTVGDFLGEIPGGIAGEPIRRLPRMKALMYARREAEIASRRLKRALSQGTLTEEKSAELEGVIERNERLIARKLARHSALELRRVLDTGRVADDRRTQWLESSIEKGLAVLLQQATSLRASFDEKAISLEDFQKAKQQMEFDHGLMSTELMRLRQTVDEESDG